MSNKMQAESNENLPELDTYTALTAESILKDWDSPMTREEIQAQLQSKDSFYRVLLNLPAVDIYNNLLLSQAQELNNYCQDELHAITQARNEMKAGMDRSGPSEADAALKDLTQHAAEYNAKVGELTAKEAELKQEADAFIATELQEWKAMQEQHADEIIAALKNMGVEITEIFRGKLLSKLEQMAANVEISDEVIKQYKLKKHINPVMKAVIATLLEEGYA